MGNNAVTTLLWRLHEPHKQTARPLSAHRVIATLPARGPAMVEARQTQEPRRINRIRLEVSVLRALQLSPDIYGEEG